MEVWLFGDCLCNPNLVGHRWKAKESSFGNGCLHVGGFAGGLLQPHSFPLGFPWGDKKSSWILLLLRVPGYSLFSPWVLYLCLYVYIIFKGRMWWLWLLLQKKKKKLKQIVPQWFLPLFHGFQLIIGI